MLAIDEHLFEIDEAIDEVAKAFLALDDVQAYLEIKKIFLADAALQESISEFQDLKQSKSLLSVLHQVFFVSQ